MSMDLPILLNEEATDIGLHERLTGMWTDVGMQARVADTYMYMYC